MSVTTERVGSRIYFVGNTFAHKSDIKDIGGHWDADRKQWWVGAAKATQATALIARINPAAAHAGIVGLDSTAPAYAVADKLREEGHEAAADAVQATIDAPRTQRPASEVRLTGKGKHNGRACYIGATTRDGSRTLILGLPKADGSYFEKWVPSSEVIVTKRYEPRTRWNGRRGRASADVTVHTTLGSIADFIARQARDKGTDRERVQCPECDAWHAAGDACSECGGG